jgi:acetolactate synthase-1/2/3 large subunit
MVEVPADVMSLEVEVDPKAHRPLRATLSAGDPRDIDDAARMLLAASCPMILAGQGVLYAEATAELRRLAELLQAPVMTTFDGKSAFPEDHVLALGPGGGTFTGHGRHILHKSDLVLGIGCSFTRHGIATPVLPPNKQIIHLTNDSRDLHKAFAADLGILGDAKLVLGQLTLAVRDRLGGDERSNSLACKVGEQREAWLARWRAKLYSNEQPINPYRVIADFMRVVDPAEAIVTHDSGSPREQLNPFYRATRPRGYLGWGKSHQLGTGLGLAIGAKLAAPDKFCVNFMGDAAFGMTGLDFETAVRCGVPITTIVLNNSSMAIETHAMQLSHERYRTRDIGGNYANIARDLGGWGERVEDPAEIGAAIGRARRQNDDGRAALLEFVTSEEQRFSHRRGAAE